MTALYQKITDWAGELGLHGVSFTDGDLSAYATRYRQKVAAEAFGQMTYLSRNVEKRLHPAQLHSGTQSIVTVRMHYYPKQSADANTVLHNSTKAYVSRYALGRDYHKVFRNKLKQLALRIQNEVGGLGFRVFCDSAPVMELALAEKSGLGWLGKNCCILHTEEGSWFFLGEIYTNLPLEAYGYTTMPAPASKHCGSCEACLHACPTDAFVGPYHLDVEKCISYLTIEYAGSIPEPLRAQMGNRVYGCDDCQLVCPWNKFGQPSTEADFAVRHGLDNADLAVLWQWDAQKFLHQMQGSAIRRIGFEKWQRNLAVAIGNSKEPALLPLLQACKPYSDLTAEHIDWAQKRLHAFIR